jgi:hypothetical protein
VADPFRAARGTMGTATTHPCVCLAAYAGRLWRTSAWAQGVRSCLDLAWLAGLWVFTGLPPRVAGFAFALLRDGRSGGNAVCVVFCSRGL